MKQYFHELKKEEFIHLFEPNSEREFQVAHRLMTTSCSIALANLAYKNGAITGPVGSDNYENINCIAIDDALLLFKEIDPEWMIGEVFQHYNAVHALAVIRENFISENFEQVLSTSMKFLEKLSLELNPIYYIAKSEIVLAQQHASYNWSCVELSRAIFNNKLIGIFISYYLDNQNFYYQYLSRFCWKC
jgi:hypothetical protein